MGGWDTIGMLDFTFLRIAFNHSVVPVLAILLQKAQSPISMVFVASSLARQDSFDENGPVRK